MPITSHIKMNEAKTDERTFILPVDGHFLGRLSYKNNSLTLASNRHGRVLQFTQTQGKKGSHNDLFQMDALPNHMLQRRVSPNSINHHHITYLWL